MKILFLGPDNDSQLRLVKYLTNRGHIVEKEAERINIRIIESSHYDFIVCYGYRYIIEYDIITGFQDRAINLHISYLPWNKGADPNLWSILMDTPKGVTIHKLDAGIDTGEILCQKKIHVSSEDTLQSSYAKLIDSIEELFIVNWPDIEMGNLKSIQRVGPGSYHRMVDKEPYMHLLVKGWDTKIIDLLGKAL